MTLQKSLFFFVGESSFVVRSDPLICYFKQSTLFSFISTTRVLFSFLASQSYIEPAYSRLIDLLDNWSRIIAGYFCYFKKRKNTVLSTAAARFVFICSFFFLIEVFRCGTFWCISIKWIFLILIVNL